MSKLGAIDIYDHSGCSQQLVMAIWQAGNRLEDVCLQDGITLEAILPATVAEKEFLEAKKSEVLESIGSLLARATFSEFHVSWSLKAALVAVDDYIQALAGYLSESDEEYLNSSIRELATEMRIYEHARGLDRLYTKETANV